MKPRNLLIIACILLVSLFFTGCIDDSMLSEEHYESLEAKLDILQERVEDFSRLMTEDERNQFEQQVELEIFRFSMALFDDLDSLTEASGEAEAAATFPVAASGIAGRLPDPQGATVEVPNLCADRPGEARAGREAAHPWRVHRPRRSTGRAHRGATKESEEREVPGQDPHGRCVRRALDVELAAGRYHDQGVSEDHP